ncbi:unnamed protein product [Candidula unifasciata]|uniref:Serine/threonine-protein phosphatase 4 regulatory subunit 2 n=1 Tax=Candidula unifasciata TaxID=100452 RepID=A0A8S3Z7I2_9EUPU|nr:unnamed protein product [Candidula unifasciata]
MDQVIEELRQRLSSEHIPDRPNVENVRFDVMRDRIMDAINKFNGAPFTIQRLCELLVDPKRHYRRSDKFLRGLEKNVLVVSTVDPFGRKVVSESGIKHLVNGIDSNGSPFFPRDSNITSNLPPVPGWVTTSSPRPQNTPATETSAQKPPEQKSPTSSLPASRGDSGNGFSSLDADQKEAAVHSEVVVEETVVTMDTSETGTVATDGGEAMAEVEDNEEEMQGDDTSASSSSSSPEVSDTGESSAAQTETNSAMTSCAQASTWTSDSSETDNSMDTSSSDCNQYSSDSSVSSHDVQQSPSEQAELTSSSEASSPQEGCLETNDLVDTLAESSSESASCSLHDQESSAKSSDTSAVTDNVAALPTGSDFHESDNGDSCSTAASDSSTGTDEMPSSTDSSSCAADLKSHEPLPSTASSLTEVATSLTTDLLPSSTTLVRAETQDSVAGLERLVDSVDSSVLQAPFSSVSALPLLACSLEQNSEPPTLSSVDSSLDCKDTDTKHHKLSEEGLSSVSASYSIQESTSSEAVASSSGDTSIKSDTLSDSTVGTPNATTEDQNTELIEPPTTVACRAEAAEGSSVVTSDSGTSLPPQLSSPDDSQGFDVTENMSNDKTEAESDLRN